MSPFRGKVSESRLSLDGRRPDKYQYPATTVVDSQQGGRNARCGCHLSEDAYDAPTSYLTGEGVDNTGAVSL